MTQSEIRKSIEGDPALARLFERASAELAKDPGHDLAHSLRVALWTVKLGAGAFRAEAAIAAALLHDSVNPPKNSSERSKASELSAAKARSLLPEYGFTEPELTDICNAIRTHSFSRGEEPVSALGRALQDADRLEALGAIGLFRTFATGVVMGAEWVHEQDPWGASRSLDDRKFSIDHFFLKLLKLPSTMKTEAGRSEALRRARFLEEFLAQLGEELGVPYAGMGSGTAPVAGAGAEPKSFKGWVVPGPGVPGGIEPGPNESLDALSGKFRIFQLREGHRFSTDDLLVAWFGTSQAPAARSVLDLGSGIGSVGMVAAWRLPGARFVTIEAQSESVKLACKSARYNGLEGRYEIREGDFRTSNILGPAEKFDLVLGSPPYFPLGSGVESEHPQKLACRFEVRGDVADYCRIASEHLAPGGLFSCVFPVQPLEQENRVKEGARAAGLQIIRQRPIVLREGEPPLLGVFAMMRSTDLPEKFRETTHVDPPLVIRRRDGSVHPEYSVVKLSIGFPP